MRSCNGCNAAVPDDAETCPQCGNLVSRGFLASIAGLFRSKPATGKPASAPAPPRASAGSFKMKVEDVFSISGRGTVVTGRVSSGEVRIGDEVRIQNDQGTWTRTSVTGIEMFRKIVDVAKVDDNVGLLLRKVGRQDVAVGTMIESA
jgi:hypothetical protein